MIKRLPLLLLFVVLPIAASAFGDTVTMRDGTSYDGATIMRSSRTFVTFKDQNGTSHRLAMKKVKSLAYSSSANSAFHRPLAASTTYGAGMIIPSGTEFSVRSNGAIDSKTATVGQKFLASVDRDILDSSGALAIPKGSVAELVIKKAAGGGMSSTSELVLDVDSVTAAGKRYVVTTADVNATGRQGLGANKRTAEMVGGGAAVGALIGALVGHGKGAAIGAAVGAGAGAGGEVLTKGKEVRVPAETILNFKLTQDLRLEPARQGG